MGAVVASTELSPDKTLDLLLFVEHGEIGREQERAARRQAVPPAADRPLPRHGQGVRPRLPQGRRGHKVHRGEPYLGFQQGQGCSLLLGSNASE